MNFDLLTDRETRQLRAFCNDRLGRRLKKKIGFERSKAEMGDMADYIIDRTVDDLTLHEMGDCFEDCVYCEEEFLTKEQQKEQTFRERK